MQGLYDGSRCSWTATGAFRQHLNSYNELAETHSPDYASPAVPSFPKPGVKRRRRCGRVSDHVGAWTTTGVRTHQELKVQAHKPPLCTLAVKHQMRRAHVLLCIGIRPSSREYVLFVLLEVRLEEGLWCRGQHRGCACVSLQVLLPCL